MNTNKNSYKLGDTVSFYVDDELASGKIINLDGEHVFVQEPNGNQRYIFTDEIEDNS